MDTDKQNPRDDRTRAEVEADEIEAIRESSDTTLKPLAETLDEPVEQPDVTAAQGDVPGLDDNSRLDGSPSWDKARDIADEHPVGSDPENSEQDAPAHEQAAAFRDGKPAGPAEADVQVRPAGPGATRSGEENWDEVDEAADESFPASDPPARY